MKYYLRKLLSFILTLILVSLVTFAVFQILPGNPVDIILGLDADEAQAAALTQKLGLDKPMYLRYLSWIAGIFRGDMGTSIRYNQPVTQIIGSALAVTGSLTFFTMLWTVVIGLPLGLFIARYSKKKGSLILSMLSQVSLSVPAFCMAIFLINIFAVRIKWFNSIGYTPFSQSPVQWFRSLLLPSLSLALGTAAILIRYIKVSVYNQMKMDYVRTAKSKGVCQRAIMYKHVFRNSLIPVITIAGVIVADVLGGSIIIENVFLLPGIGKMISEAVSSRDLPLIQGLVMYLTFIVLICNFAVDIIYSAVDPRIKR